MCTTIRPAFIKFRGFCFKWYCFYVSCGLIHGSTTVIYSVHCVFTVALLLYFVRYVHGYIKFFPSWRQTRDEVAGCISKFFALLWRTWRIVKFLEETRDASLSSYLALKHSLVTRRRSKFNAMFQYKKSKRAFEYIQ